MKIIGIMTEDFSIYYELIKELKERQTPFTSLSIKDKVPPNIGVIITTNNEKMKIKFKHVLTVFEVDDIPLLIDKALKMLEGKERFRNLVIGIDPGKRPGMAVLGDGDVLKTYQPSTPEDAVKIVKAVQKAYPEQYLIIRIGHGAPTQRNRIINALYNPAIRLELVDETNTTQKMQQPDIKAAIDIALSTGIEIKTKYEVNPTPGEIRDIQRISRMESSGAVTISKPLAVKVANGNLTIEEAIDLQKKKN